MEKIWKKASQAEYQKCFDILNTQSLIERETYRQFAIQLFEIAQKQLGCTGCTLKFINSEQNDLGFSTVLDNSVTLNLNKMEKHTLYKTVSTIYHELTHIRQQYTESKKKIDVAVPAKFPYVHCYGKEQFLPAEILGISPFLFYYTCQHEKQARDVGSECAMDLFVELKNIAETNQAKTGTITRNGTIRLIERCIGQVQTRWDTENANNAQASAQINAFIKQNPNFLQNAFNKIVQEYYNDVRKLGVTYKDIMQCEARFNKRIGVLVLMGCDDNLKGQILNFVASNFTNKGEIFTTLISVADSPYSRTTKNDLVLLYKFAEQVNCPKNVLLNYLTSWDRNYVNAVVNNLPVPSNNNGRDL